jgi:hypothetical protein
VRENGALLAGRIVKLLGIRPAGALQVQDVDRFIAPLSKDLGEQRPDVFIEQQADLGH